MKMPPDITATRKLLITLIYQISSAEFQENAWVKKISGPFLDFGELMCHFFDDLNIPKIVEMRNEYGFSEEEARGIQSLYKKLDAYCEAVPDDVESEAVYIDSRWKDIRKFASNVYKTLKVGRHENPLTSG